MLLYASIPWCLAHQTVTQRAVYFPLWWYNFHMTWSSVHQWTIAFSSYYPGRGSAEQTFKSSASHSHLGAAQCKHSHLLLATRSFIWALLVWMSGLVPFPRTPKCYLLRRCFSFKFFSPYFPSLSTVHFLVAQVFVVLQPFLNSWLLW